MQFIFYSILLNDLQNNVISIVFRQPSEAIIIDNLDNELLIDIDDQLLSFDQTQLDIVDKLIMTESSVIDLSTVSATDSFLLENVIHETNNAISSTSTPTQSIKTTQSNRR
jgi:hypothetical protein